MLVVDDDPAVVDFVCDVLRDSGYACEVARDGAEALVVAERARPSLILLDIQMPRMNGREFAAAMRGRLRQVPIIVMTAPAPADREADRRNASGVLRKPFAVDELVSAVRRLV